MAKYHMENFKEWLTVQEMGLGGYLKTAGNIAADLAFGPEVGIDGKQAVDTATTAASVATFATKQFYFRKRCQMGNVQSCMTGCRDYHDPQCCTRLQSAPNTMGKM